MALHAFGGYGLELEYMIVDRDTLDVRPLAQRLLEQLEPVIGPDGTRISWSNELVAHVVELKNEQPCPHFDLLVAAFEAEVAHANEALLAHGARLMPTGMHPWMNPAAETEVWSHDSAGIYAAYERIFDCRTHGWANVQSMHLNLPFANDREFGRLHAAVRLVLPILPALAASSPIYEGRRAPALDQRMAFYRANADPLQTIAGEVVPEPVATREEYEARILRPMYEEIAPFDPRGILQHEWLNSRGAIARFDRSAIEIRVLDVQECPLADVAIAAAVCSVTRMVWEREARLPQARNALDTRVLASILDACIRDGDCAEISEPSYLSMLGCPGRPCTAGDLWKHLVLDCAPDTPVHSPALRDALDVIMDEGPLARRILTAMGRNVDADRLREIYAALCDCLDAGRMFSPD
ncbi:MAG: glutamate-cysteine ligase family protein [Pseudomonadota bacterium]|nr:glutamate-cysteine ligase family protein [Pseudomonadota bacterium]